MGDDIDLYRRILKQMPEAVIFADRNGIVRLWNEGAGTVFGFSRQEIEGKNLDVIIPEALRARHWEAYRRAMTTGILQLGNRVLPTRGIHKSGRTIYIDLSFALVRDDGEAVLGAAAVGRDITEKYQSEKAQRMRLAELEKAIREKSGAA